MHINSRWLIVFVAILLTISITACGGLGDWTFDDLPGEGYEITRFNGQDISLDKSGKTVIDRYIIAFCYDTKYIGVQRIPIHTPYNEIFNVEDLDFSTLEYFLVDTQTDIIYGPCTQDEYANYLDEFNISEMTEWIVTDGRVVATRESSWPLIAAVGAGKENTE